MIPDNMNPYNFTYRDWIKAQRKPGNTRCKRYLQHLSCFKNTMSPSSQPRAGWRTSAATSALKQVSENAMKESVQTVSPLSPDILEEERVICERLCEVDRSTENADRNTLEMISRTQTEALEQERMAAPDDETNGISDPCEMISPVMDPAMDTLEVIRDIRIEEPVQTVLPHACGIASEEHEQTRHSFRAVMAKRRFKDRRYNRGLFRYKKWWFRETVDIKVRGELIGGIPIFADFDTLRVINDKYSYFIPVEKIDYIRTTDGLNCNLLSE